MEKLKLRLKSKEIKNLRVIKGGLDDGTIKKRKMKLKKEN